MQRKCFDCLCSFVKWIFVLFALYCNCGCTTRAQIFYFFSYELIMYLDNTAADTFAFPAEYSMSKAVSSRSYLIRVSFDVGFFDVNMYTMVCSK